VGSLLLSFGRELESEGAAQVGGSFSGDEDADALLRTDPNAFLLGVLFTQGIPAERAWAAPLALLRRLGTLDVGYLATHGDEVALAVQAPPMLHRFKHTLPVWIVDAARRLKDEYDGCAAAIWPAGDSVLAVTERLSAFQGIGRKKSVMAVEILTRHLGVELHGREAGCVAYDVQVRRVFLRSGLADEDSVDAIEAAARAVFPDSPGTLDLPAWLIGREWCRPRAPRCDACRLGAVCPRLLDRTPEGVGRRSAGSVRGVGRRSAGSVR
jgi:uncharacterized HhH-GPD family protein